MGLILDLAVVALALVVIGSLALLAWTLAISAVAVGPAGARRGRPSARRRSPMSERRLATPPPRGSDRPWTTSLRRRAPARRPTTQHVESNPTHDHPTTDAKREPGYRGSLPPRQDHLAEPWILIVAASSC